MRNSITLLIILGFCTQAFSQSQVVRRADIEKEKQVFITNELGLSESNSKVFWPIYKAYEKEIKNLKIKQRQIKKALKNNAVLSESEQYSLMKKLISIDKQKANIQLKYLPLFAETIGKKKAVALFKAEDDFKRELFKKLKNLPQPPPPSPPGHDNH